jgi:hypothetical protein
MKFMHLFLIVSNLLVWPHTSFIAGASNSAPMDVYSRAMERNPIPKDELLKLINNPKFAGVSCLALSIFYPDDETATIVRKTLESRKFSQSFKRKILGILSGQNERIDCEILYEIDFSKIDLSALGGKIKTIPIQFQVKLNPDLTPEQINFINFPVELVPISEQIKAELMRNQFLPSLPAAKIKDCIYTLNFFI